MSYLVFTALFLVLCSIAACAAPGDREYLGDIQDRILSSHQGWGKLGIDTCAHAPDQVPIKLRINGVDYARGLGHHAPGDIVVDLNGEYSRFQSEVGVQDQNRSPGSVGFQVFVDGKKAFDSGVMRDGDVPKKVDVSVKGAMELKLVVTDAGDGITCDCADWADALLIRESGPKPRREEIRLDVAPFARVVTSDPSRKDGTNAGRTEEFPAKDIYLESDLAPGKDGSYTVPGDTGSIGLVWMETRSLKETGIEFSKGSRVPPVESAVVEAWTGESEHQGGWHAVDGSIEQSGGKWVFKPKSVDGLSGIRKLRWILQGQRISVRRLSALSGSRTGTVEFTLTAEKPFAKGIGQVGIYNGEIEGAKAETVKWDLSKPLRLDVLYTKPALTKQDNTVLLLHLPKSEFGVSVQDVIDNGCVYVRDLGAFVTRMPGGPTLEAYKKSIDGKKTVLERVREMPDQTFEQAMAKTHHVAQNAGPTMISLPCDNFKVIVQRDGVIEFPDGPAENDLKAKLGTIRPHFGSGSATGMTRHLSDGWFPAVVNEITLDGIVYSQRAFVAPYGPSGLPVLVVEYGAKNSRNSSAQASVSIKLDGGTVNLGEAGNAVGVSSGGQMVGWFKMESAAPLGRDIGADTLLVTGTLQSGQTASFSLLVPGTPDASNQRGSDSSETLYKAFEACWNKEMAGAMQIDIPDKKLLDVIKASQVHCLLAARNRENGKLIEPWIASMSYGPLESESNSIIRAMDMLGYAEFARKSLDFFIDQYNKAGYLTTGYTLMGTGWHLWTLGEHYELTRDDQWMKSVSPEVARVCQWVERQREKTKEPASVASKRPEFGLMPPGVIADWNVYAYYFCLNGYYAAGLRHAANALAKIGYPGADQLLKDSEDFKKDLLGSYLRTRSLTPVMLLQDGTWAPGHPTQVCTPGRVGDFYPGEDGNRSWAYDVEIGPHQLIPQGILASDSKDAKWIMDEMEDDDFLQSGWFDYPSEGNHKDWFDLGGFSKVQPYYTRNAEIYAMEDDVKPFIRSYFNQLATLLNTENLSFWEHFNATAAWNKTHETGYFLQQTKWMLVNERKGGLWLAPFVTNNWMEDGMVVSAKNAPTSFGPVSFHIKSSVKKGYIEAVIDPPKRSAPTEIVIRLRHPEGKRIKSVTVNGKSDPNFDPESSTVHLKPSQSTLTVRASY